MEIKITVIRDGKEISLCDLSEESLRKAREASKPIIRVPDSIKFVEYSNGKALVNSHRQVLLIGHNNPKEYMVYSCSTHGSFLSCKLTPCKHEDLKCGDWAYVSMHSNPALDRLCYYHLVLDKEYYAFWSSRDVLARTDSYTYWWKVEVI